MNGQQITLLVGKEPNSPLGIKVRPYDRLAQAVGGAVRSYLRGAASMFGRHQMRPSLIPPSVTDMHVDWDTLTKGM